MRNFCIEFIVCPCLALGSLLVGCNSTQLNSFSLDRLIFQMSFKFALNSVYCTYQQYCKYLQRYTCQSQLGLQYVQIFLQAAYLWSWLGQSISCTPDLAQRASGSSTRIRNQVSSSILQRRPTYLSISHKTAFISSRDTFLRSLGCQSISLMTH